MYYDSTTSKQKYPLKLNPDDFTIDMVTTVAGEVYYQIMVPDVEFKWRKLNWIKTNKMVPFKWETYACRTNKFLNKPEVFNALDSLIKEQCSEILTRKQIQR